MHKLFMTIGAAMGGLGVMLGAFGAHKLKSIAPDAVPTFQTGVQYQMYHALALIALAIVFDKLSIKWAGWAGTSFITGIVLFSSSLYALAFLKATGKVGLGGLGIITPIGGLFFIAGWLFLIFAIKK
ncbi:MAG: DUF423 domain-containing protein [Niabella sp.]